MISMGLWELNDPAKRLSKHQREQQLLKVAKRLFLRNGYLKTTTAAIARAAGITEPILYRHFRGKRDIFLRALSELRAEEEKRWEQLGSGVHEPAEKWSGIINYFTEVSRSGYCHVLLCFCVETRDDVELADAVRSITRFWYEGVREAFTVSKDSHLLRECAEPDILVLDFLALVMGMAPALEAFAGGRPVDEVLPGGLRSYLKKTLVQGDAGSGGESEA